MIAISKLSQARAALVRSLHRRKGRVEEGAYLAEGERLLEELAADPSGVRFLFGMAERLEWLQKRFSNIPVFSIGAREASLFATENAQGVGAVVSVPEPVALEEIIAGDSPVLYLDHLADPGNLGTILRTAEWFGIRGVLLGEGTVDPYNPKTVRSSMGAVFRLPFAGEISIGSLVATGLPLLALDGAGEDVLGRASLPEHAIYIIGNEAHGLSPEIRQNARLIAIQGSGRGESLNAAIAAAILMYELGEVKIQHSKVKN